MKRHGVLLLIVSTLAACTTAAPPISPLRPQAVSPIATPIATPTATPTATTEAALPAATPSDGRAAVYPNTIIVYQREGGFAGTSDKWTIYPTGRIVAADGAAWQVPAEQVEPLFASVQSSAFASLATAKPATKPCADCYTHTVTVFGPGAPQTVTFTDGTHLPAPLPQILAEVNRFVTR